MKAIASGNPAVLTLAEADAEFQRLTLLKKNHLDEQYVARKSVKDLPATIASLNDRLKNLSADESTAKAHDRDRITIGKQTYADKDAPTVLGGRLDALPKNVSQTTRIPLGIHQGLRFGIVLHQQFPPEVFLEGASNRRYTLSREHQGPRAVLNALERLVTGYGSECVRVRQELAIAESQLRDYQARLGKPFAHVAYLSELTLLRDQLKVALSGGNTGSDEDSGPDAFGLAEKIKSLKAANTIEATPQRERQKHSTAEEPVTARIRSRTERNAASDSLMKADVAPGTGAPESASSENSSGKPPMTFQERIILEQQLKDNGQTPP